MNKKIKEHNTIPNNRNTKIDRIKSMKEIYNYRALMSKDQKYKKPTKKTSFSSIRNSKTGYPAAMRISKTVFLLTKYKNNKKQTIKIIFHIILFWIDINNMLSLSTSKISYIYVL